jgi:hypothetical protein
MFLRFLLTTIESSESLLLELSTISVSEDKSSESKSIIFFTTLSAFDFILEFFLKSLKLIKLLSFDLSDLFLLTITD